MDRQWRRERLVETKTSTRCVHDLISEQARQTPDAVALRAGEETVTYAGLEERCEKLAGDLRAQGAGPEVVVAVALPRSIDLVVDLIAIHKAGSAFLPIDPNEPRERAAFMLEDAGARLMITTAGINAVDGSTPVRSASGGPHPLPANLAYVIYTSRSTGKPKGVMIEHGQLLNYVTWAADHYQVAEGNGAPLHSPVTFALSLAALFTPLVCGRTVTIVPESPLPINALASELERGGFSFVKLTPTHLQLLAELLSPAAAKKATRR